MRLSYAPISLLQFFLITLLTLFLKPDARAQSMLAVNSSHHHYEHRQHFIDITDDESIQPGAISEKYVAEVGNGYPSTVNFLHGTIPVFPVLNSHKIYTGYHPLRVRIYSTSIENSMRVTVKLLKVVIVPLWYTRGVRRQNR